MMECDWPYDRLQLLFEENMDNKIYSYLINKLDAVSEKENDIYETRAKMSVLLDYTLDVFPSDFLDNKIYQLPYGLYHTAKVLFSENMAAVVSEALMSVARYGYRQCSNLLRLICFDDNKNDFLQKLVVFFTVLDEKCSLENLYREADLGFYKEFTKDLAEDICRADFDETVSNLSMIRRNISAYRRILIPVICDVNEYRIPEDQRGIYRQISMGKKSDYMEMLDQGAVDFLHRDIEEYVSRKHLAEYDSFWIWGSGEYKNTLDYILQCKSETEYAVLRLMYENTISKRQAAEALQNWGSERRQIMQRKMRCAL
jgi:hypothetical protein